MKEWTLMMYMPAAETCAAMDAIASTDAVDAVAQYRTRNESMMRRRQLQRASRNDEIASPALVDYIAWANDNHPARRRMLVLRSHGLGLGPSLRGSRELLTIAELKNALAQGRAIVGR